MKEFYSRINDFVKENPEYSKDDAFVIWFIHSQTNDLHLATKSVTGVSGDKNMDAIWINPEARSVNILQAKLRQTWGKTLEKRNDVLVLPNLINIFTDKKEKEKLFQKLDAKIINNLKKAITLVEQQQYEINLYYITTGKVSKPLREAAQPRHGQNYTYRIFDHLQISIAFQDWLEGVAPAIPTYELPIQVGNFDRAIINKNDPLIESWITTASSTNIAKMYNKIGKVLFAKNIRGYLGESDINQSMVDTLQNEPDNFWYYNNGITIVCDNCVEITSKGKTILRLERPQVINGQQTTRTVSENPHTKAHVLIKVFKVPRQGDYGYSSYHNIVNQIVKATNWQNKISHADLVSNDLFQVELERQFRDRKYQYLRKREKGSESRCIGFKPLLKIKKEQLAKDVAACILGAAVARSKGEELFDSDKYYKKVFAETSPDFYLACYLLENYISVTKKNSARNGRLPQKYALYNSNWIVVQFFWHYIGNLIDSGEDARRFRKMYHHGHRGLKIHKLFERMIIIAFKMAWRCWNANKKRADGRIRNDNDFFKDSNIWKIFMNYSKTKNKKEFKAFEKLTADFKRTLKNYQLS